MHSHDALFSCKNVRRFIIVTLLYQAAFIHHFGGCFMRSVSHRLVLFCILALVTGSIGCDSKEDAKTTNQTSAQTSADVADTASGTTPEVESQTTATPKPEQLEAALEGTDAKASLEAFDRQIEGEKRMFESRPKEWLRAARISSAYAQRARLTNSWDDWDKALEWNNKAFEAAPEGSGPLWERASLNYSLHNFDKVGPDLDAYSKRIILKDTEKSAISQMRGDLAFHSGDLEEALKHYEEAQQHKDSPSIRVALGHYHFKTGDLEKAREHFDKAIDLAPKHDKLTRAWALLQRGIIELDTGNWRDARRYFEEANTTYAGWFLIEEHLAEVTGLLGDNERAKEMYEGIVARVPAGEFMEALADTYEALGDEAKAKEWKKRAGEAYARDMKRYPQAVYGHGMDYFLTGEDTAKALEIAQKNHEARPGFEAKTKLAQAHIRAGQLTEAEELVKASLEAGWNTADLHATAARLYALQGNADEAKKQEARAKELHPEAMADAEWIAPLEPIQEKPSDGKK